MFDQPFRLLDHHFGDLNVALRRFVERGGDDLALHAALHVGNFFRPLVDQQDQQEHFGMVVGDRLGDVLQQHRLTRTRRGDDQRALAFALRRDDVDHSRGLVLHRRVQCVERQLLIGIERGQIVEIGPHPDLFGVLEIHARKLGQGEIAFAFLRSPDLAFHRVTGAQAHLADLIGRDVDVVRPGEIVGFGRTQEAKTVLQHLDRADAHDFFVVILVFRQFAQDAEHQILAAHGAGALDA